MSLESILARWRSDPSIAPNITAWKTIPSREASWSELPGSLAPELHAALLRSGVTALYAHQAESWDRLQSGQNIVLATGTASGKSLAYQLPALNAALHSPRARSLFLFPTKALARDQLSWLDHFQFSKAAVYDGDTPQRERSAIRSAARILISNPDMLHLGILPYHTSWADFFSNLELVVLDEIHTYRGVFGSHVANVIRRLKRVCAHYGAMPQFILTSATIGNPLSLAESLAEVAFTLIDQDASSRGTKHFLVYNPPVIDPGLGLRASMQRECIRLASDLLSAGLQTILFGRSRRSVEFMITDLKASSHLPEGALQPYRSGYLPAHRREIEASLRSGSVRGIAATTALELGIDIGGLDSAVLAGYPGSIAGVWQQAGRAGRSEKSSLAVLVASSNPLDQYLAHNPAYLFENNPENGLIDADNLLIALAHLQCGAYELPFVADSSYGKFSPSQTSELLEILKAHGKLHESNQRYFWMSDAYPAAEVSLRSTSSDQIALVLQRPDKKQLLGTIDYESALWMVHPGAIYLHAGEVYLVEDLDLDRMGASLVLSQEPYYTEAEKQTDFSLTRLGGESSIPGASKAFGEIQVTNQVSGFKKINWDHYEILGREGLDLPPTNLQTMGMWLTLSKETEERLRASGEWTSSPNDYGPDWDSIRAQVLERDRHACDSCGISLPEAGLHVHHKIPLRSFPSFQEANRLDNLVSLCPRCHQRAESIVRVNSGIKGLGYILHSLSPLVLMCDPGDLGLYTDFASPFAAKRPIVMLYEQIPAGIGFSRHLFDELENLLGMSHESVSQCSCESGCPSCVGPGGEMGSGGKKETLAILGALLER